jgi:hypothetical protein
MCLCIEIANLEAMTEQKLFNSMFSIINKVDREVNVEQELATLGT